MVLMNLLNYIRDFGACIIYNASFLSMIIYLAIKFLKKSNKTNFKFYNDIAKNKNVYILDESNDDVKLNIIKNAFKIKSEQYPEAGFDCEWPPSKNVSLIQIAFPDGSCFLIRLLERSSHIPIEIMNWMKDPTKLKFGIGVLEDGKKLESQWNIDLRGCVDLRHLAVRVKPNGLDKMGLKSFALNWLGVNYPYDDNMNKVLSVQCSDWSQSALDSKQIEYASLDALVGSLCPVEFLCKKLSLSPIESLNKLENIRSYCQGCIDLRFKSRKQTEKHKTIDKRIVKLSCFNRSSPIYDNTILLTPDGELLSRLSRKKAEWYLKKELGVQISEDPLVVQLLFEPSGRASGQNDYYIQEKENICVVCGCREGCVKKNIIPIEYRRHYPVSHKSHKSHDVLPLCVHCHRLSNVIDDNKKKQLALEYNAPLGSRDSVLNKTDFNRSRVKNAAKALLYQHKIPMDRIKELQSIVAEFYEMDTTMIQDKELSNNILLEAVNLEIATRDGKFISHGAKVVSTLVTSISLVNFEVMWRQHFVDQMQPKFLPLGWDTHHRIDRYSIMDME